MSTMKKSALFKFLLYVADDTQNSTQASANLTALCQKHLPGRHQIEVVDVFRNSKRALADHIFMTPVLIRVSPSPARRVIGTLSQTDKVLSALGVEAPGT
jgi:circadian clock protein KaiB